MSAPPSSDQIAAQLAAVLAEARDARRRGRIEALERHLRELESKRVLAMVGPFRAAPAALLRQRAEERAYYAKAMRKVERRLDEA